MQIKKVTIPLPDMLGLPIGILGMGGSIFLIPLLDSFTYLSIAVIFSLVIFLSSLYILCCMFATSYLSDHLELFYPSIGSSLERKLEKIDKAIDIASNSMKGLPTNDPYYNYFHERMIELTQTRDIVSQESRNKELAKAAKYTSKVIRKELR